MYCKCKWVYPKKSKPVQGPVHNLFKITKYDGNKLFLEFTQAMTKWKLLAKGVGDTLDKRRGFPVSWNSLIGNHIYSLKKVS